MAIIAPLVLAGVAINHQVLATSQKLDPWKGGGFGMFATVGIGRERVILAYGITRSGLVIDDSGVPGLGQINTFTGLGRRAVALPDDATLRKLAEISLSYHQRVEGSPELDDDIVKVHIEVATTSFDADRREVRIILINSVEVEQ